MKSTQIAHGRTVHELDYEELLLLKEALCYGADALPEMTEAQKQICDEAFCADEIPDDLVFALYADAIFQKEERK